MLGEPVRDRRTERREATKAEILEAAWAQARAGGLASLSLRDVARTVGMRAPSLYEYFGSKHDIYDAMYAQGAREFAARSEALELTGDQLADLKVVARFFIGFCVEDEARYQLLFQRTIPGFEPSPESFAISVENLRTMQAHFAELGLEEQRAVDLYTALGTGLADQQISNDPGGDRWIRLIDEAVEMFVHHLQRTRAGTKKGRATR
jgi:AcrR family transcriptional regulator